MSIYHEHNSTISDNQTMALPPLSRLHASEPHEAFSCLQLASATTIAAHYGASSDAALPIGTIAISRLARVKDAAYLDQLAATPIAAAVLSALRAVVLRLMPSVDGANPVITCANIETLFNLLGSTTKYQSHYDGQGFQGSLQSRVPWPQYRIMVGALLDALVAVRKGSAGAMVGQMLLDAALANASARVDTGAVQAAIATLVTAIEPDLRRRLGATSVPSTASSSSSSAAGASSSAASESGSVLPALPAATTGTSFEATLQRLVSTRVHRHLSPEEAAEVTAALDEGLSILQAGGVVARQQLLGMNMIDALAIQGGAWLWAVTLEATASNAPVVATLTAAIVDGSSAVAVMLFAQAAADFGE